MIKKISTVFITMLMVLTLTFFSVSLHTINAKSDENPEMVSRPHYKSHAFLRKEVVKSLEKEIEKLKEKHGEDVTNIHDCIF